MEIPQALAEEVRRGRVVLFLGAGASIGSRRPDGAGPPNAKQLAAQLRERFLGHDFPEMPLENIAEVAINEAGLRPVQEYIAAGLRPLVPDSFHQLIPQFVWYGIATTNYDVIVEEAYRQCPSPLQELVPVFSVSRPIDDIARSKKQLVYLKLHGCITNTDDPECPLVLTAEHSLAQQDKRERLYRTLIEWGHDHPIVFAGHSLQDTDLRVVLRELDRLKDYRPSYYLVSPDLNEALIRFWNTRRVIGLKGILSEFLTELDRVVPVEGRVLTTTVSRDRPINRWLVEPDEMSDATHLALEADLELVHSALPASPAEPRQFYRGFDLGWLPIQQDWDVRRRLTDTILSEVVLADEGDRAVPAELIVVKAEAGAGKSVLLRRIAWDAVVEFDKFCIRLRRHGDLRYRDLAALYRAVKQRMFLFADSAADHADALHSILSMAHRENLPLTLITAERLNEWNMGCKILEPFLSEAYPLRYLSHREIEDLVRLLEEHDSLFHLAGATWKERIEAFEKRAGRQLLVALHEATLGMPFEDILIDEFNSIRPRKAQALYLTVCVLNRLGVPVRAGLISRTHQVPFQEFRQRLLDPLEHVVRARLDDRLGDMVYTARHPYIAQIVFERILTDEIERFNEYARLLRHMNLSYSTDADAFRQMVKGRTLLELFPEHSAVEELFDMAERLDPGDPNILHQRALYEMRRPNGNLRKAYDLLKRAQRSRERDSSIKHSLAELALVRAQRAQSAFEREKHREECRAQATALLNDEVSGRFARHTLAKVLLDELEESLGQEPTDGAELDSLVREIERVIDRGLAEDPGDSYLASAEADFRRLLSEHEKGRRALEEAFEHNRRDTYIAGRLSKLLIEEGNLEGAETVLKEALEASPSDKRLNYIYAKFLRARGEFNPERQIYYLRRSFTEWDDHYDAQFWYARFAFESSEQSIRQRSSLVFDQLRRARVPHDERRRIRSYLEKDGRREIFRGTIVKLEDTYGFVRLDGRNEDIFLYAGSCEEDVWAKLSTGDRCAFQIGFTFRGPIAVNLERLETLY